MDEKMASELAYKNGYANGFNDAHKADSESSLEMYRIQAMSAASQLRYKQEFIERIEKAETINEITRIMVTARKDRFGS